MWGYSSWPLLENQPEKVLGEINDLFSCLCFQGTWFTFSCDLTVAAIPGRTLFNYLSSLLKAFIWKETHLCHTSNWPFPANLPNFQEIFQHVKRWSSELLIPKGEKACGQWIRGNWLPREEHTPGIQHESRDTGLSHDHKRWMNKARAPFIVSIDVISLGWWGLSW